MGRSAWVRLFALVLGAVVAVGAGCNLFNDYGNLWANSEGTGGAGGANICALTTGVGGGSGFGGAGGFGGGGGGDQGAGGDGSGTSVGSGAGVGGSSAVSVGAGAGGGEAWTKGGHGHPARARRRHRRHPSGIGTAQQADCPLSTYIRCWGMGPTACSERCFAIGAYCDEHAVHPENPSIGIGNLKQCMENTLSYTCTYCYSNGDVCTFIRARFGLGLGRCTNTGGKGCE
jgi:hypothetical protein